MAVPTITGPNVIDTCETLTNHSGWGIDSTKWILDDDLELTGTYCIGLPPKNSGDGGYGYQHGSNIDLSATGNLLFFWMFVGAKNLINTSANYGVYIRITDSTTSWTTTYSDFIVGGSNVAWVGGGWHLVVLDATRTRDRGSGTPTLTAIRRVGMGKNAVATANKATFMAFDNIMVGTTAEVTGVTSSSATHNFNDNGASADTITRGSGDFTTDGFESGDTIRVSGTVSNDGEYTVVTAAALTLTLATGVLSGTETGVTSNVDAAITLESIFQKDGPTDGTYRGIVAKNRDNDYEINYNMIIGDESGSARTFFLSRNEKCIFVDQPLSETTTQLGITAAEDTGNTIIAFGDSSGTGDDRVGFAGSIYSQDSTFMSTTTDGAALCTIDVSAAIDTCEFFGSTFLSINGGADFAADTTHLVTNCTFSGCGQVGLSTVEARNLIFSAYDSASDAALLWNSSIDIENSRFLANLNDAGTASAIEHDTAGEYDYTNLEFSGNDYDVHNSSSGAVTVNNLGTSNASTHKETGGGSTSIVSAYVFTLTQLKSGSEVRIYRQSDNAELDGIESSGTSFVYNYNYAGDVDVWVHILHIDWLWIRNEYTLSDSDQTIPISYSTDRVYSNP